MKHYKISIKVEKNYKRLTYYWFRLIVNTQLELGDDTTISRPDGSCTEKY